MFYMDNYIQDKKVYRDIGISLKDFIEMIKCDCGNWKDAYIKSEISYNGCYYEGDTPSIDLIISGLRPILKNKKGNK